MGTNIADKNRDKGAKDEAGEQRSRGAKERGPCY
jgi:hypothetical protein